MKISGSISADETCIKQEEGLVVSTHCGKRQRFSVEISANFQSSDQDFNQEVVTSKRKKHSRRASKKRRKTYEPQQRRWVFSSHDLSSYRDRFVIVSYNILGVDNVLKHMDLYHHVSPQILNWDWRKNLLHEEIKCYKPSILCLQEVDQFDDIVMLLKKDGYEGVYKGRTGNANDGCAVFWKEHMFNLLHEESIEFRKFGLRDNVAQLCILRYKGRHCERNLLVGNIHVLFNPKRGDVKLGQIRLLLKKAHTLSQQWGKIPIVLTGDFNSLPQSALYQFVASSKLDLLMHDRKNISGQIEHSSWQDPVEQQRNLSARSPWYSYIWSAEEREIATGKAGCTHLQHPINLRSAYSEVAGTHNTRDTCGEPLVSSYHSKFMGTVDYIWHSEELVPIGVVDTLPINILRRRRGLPSEVWTHQPRRGGLGVSGKGGGGDPTRSGLGLEHPGWMGSMSESTHFWS
ncbi:carbon catabolite repressor protein 4 homolog 5 isoform X3 [Amborella trichopoda]|uniref:carbon catabolite repressor protein 4 homolog 5 isoform X3 n=1 Tax=Amborella trichopoda TaxID=13333 RepID=UPI0009BF7C6A|nr:carbon catabolite repressor protein 4 homolog 5 isoform X3 [Amborella trichopoda]|eukprot:XP_020523382.1 carbon catabolite repressor protein 4 homolog 5 isoform X3 [Amborella trichopoda]